MNIHRMPCKFTNAFLVEINSDCILIDSGLPSCGYQILKYLHEHSLHLNLIFITHAHIDHFGSALTIKKHTSAPIAIHHLEQFALRQGKTLLGTCRKWGKIMKFLLPLIENIYKSKPISPDLLIDDGKCFEMIGIKATCIHTPGHTAGSCSLFFENGDIFVGDLISSTGNPHIQRYFAINWSDLSKSVVKVKNLYPNRIFPGHGTYVINGKDLASL